MPVEYRRNIAGENYVTHAREGPIGRDLNRRVTRVLLEGRRSAPLGQGRAADQWTQGYPAGGLKMSHRSQVVTRGIGLVGEITADARRQGQRSSYAASVHEGSKAHNIVPRARSGGRTGWLRWPGQGGEVFRRGVYPHPGTRRGNPWLRESLKAAGD